MEVFWTIQQVDINYKQFTGGKNYAPWEAPKGYEHKKSNYWCDVLAKQAESASKTGIYEVTGEQAQSLANLGYVVIGAWMNTTRYGSPHYVTVRPGYEFAKGYGPQVTHVGGGINNERPAINAFIEGALPTVKWYFNYQQCFK
jgi:hypothetical protein